MKKNLLVIVGIVLLQVAARAQSPAPLSGNMSHDLPVLLKPGKHVAAILGRPLFNTHQDALTAKITQLIRDNPKWFTDTLPKLPVEEIPAALEKKGIKKEDLDQYEASSKNDNQLTVTGKDTLEIITTGQLISFRGQGKLHALDSLRIDAATKTALFRGQRLPFSDEAVSPHPDAMGAFKITPPAYKFVYTEDPQLQEGATMGDVRSMSMTDMRVAIGRVAESGKTMLVLMATKMVNGRTQLAVALPVVFE